MADDQLLLSDRIAAAVTDFTMRHRFAILSVGLTITLVFAAFIPRLRIFTNFIELFPRQHPYVRVYEQFRDRFGGANIISIMVRAKQGDIYNPATLTKIARITDLLDKAPGVMHEQVTSLAHRRVREMRISEEGHLAAPQILGEIPSTPEGLAELRRSVHRNKEVYGKLVSRDDTSALIMADFIQEQLDYARLFGYLQTKVKHAEEDAAHEIYVTGQPMLFGWLYFHLQELKYIFGGTAAVFVGLMILYFRRFEGVALPVITGVLSAIWGLGFVGMLGFNLDPLVLVVPLLVTARSVSHAVQMAERYYELYQEYGDQRQAAAGCMRHLFIPGAVGILTDAAGLYSISVARIPLIQKLAYFSAFWSLSIIYNAAILHPILLTLMPRPRRREHYVVPFIYKTLDLLSRAGSHRTVSVLTVGGSLVLLLVFGYWGTQLGVGDPEPGTPLLWPNSEFNVATRQINRQFRYTEPLVVIFHGKDPDNVKEPEVLHTMEAMGRYMEAGGAAGESFGIYKIIRAVNQIYRNGDPKFAGIPPTRREAAANIFYFRAGAADPGVTDPYLSLDEVDANLTVFYPDHTGDTLRSALRRAKEFAAANPLDRFGVEYKLAGGLIGILAAVNEEVEVSSWLNLGVVFVMIFLLVLVGYRSPVAAGLLSYCLALASGFSLAYMYWQGIGLNVNTLPVQAIGVGLGVDYGIYILDRIKEEFRVHRDLQVAIRRAVTTTGLAVSFTATTLVASIIFWVFFSSVRFQADMAVLLSILMVVNMLTSLTLVPALVFLIRPHFVTEGVEEAAAVMVRCPRCGNEFATASAMAAHRPVRAEA